MIESFAKYIRHFNNRTHEERALELRDFIPDLINDIQLYQASHVAIRYSITIDDQIKVHVNIWREEYIEAKIKLLGV